jgi:hypothetical protein
MHSQSIAENTPIGKLRTLFQQEDKSLEIVENDAPEPLSQPSVIRKSIIHFYFCMEGTATFEFGPHYVREIQRQHNYFFFDPGRELPFTLRMSPHSRMVVMTISLESLHQLFVHEPLPFLKPENINQKFYDEREIPSHLMVELNQLYNIHLSTSSNSIYYQGKILELLALYFSQRKADTETCPFLNDQETVRKIKNAKDYILQHMEAPPTLKELARLMGLNEYQLKAGFKEIYGNTVFGFLLDHKLDSAGVTCVPVSGIA